MKTHSLKSADWVRYKSVLRARIEVGDMTVLWALANLGHHVSDQNGRQHPARQDIAPAPKRSRTTTCEEFIQTHMDVPAGADFFTVEVLTWEGLVTSASPDRNVGGVEGPGGPRRAIRCRERLGGGSDGPPRTRNFTTTHHN